MRVCVSGAAGHLARALLPRLCGDPRIAGITGIDVAPAAFAHPKLAFVRADLADPAALAAARDADALVHLAFVVLRGRTPAAAMRRVNVEASRRLIEAARGRVVHVSSASVYGRGEALAESAPLAPLRGFLYAEHKAALEGAVAAIRPDAALVRPHIILGPHALPLLKRLVRLPVYPRLPDPQPLLQAVHEDDVADAIVRVLHADARGAFNVAHPRTFSWKSLVLANAPHARALPLPLLAAGLRAAWSLTGWGGEPGWLAGAPHPLTIDSTRAQRELGWTATRDPLAAA
jgi:nucleoside-diphosphate-sugar epimerase